MSPTKREKLLAKAETYARERKVKKAITFYRQAIELDEKDIRTRLKLSELLYQCARSEEALDILQYVGDYYRQYGFLLKSVAVYKKMLEVDPSRTDLHGTLAQLYFQLGMAPDAIRQFKSQIKALIRQGRVRDSLHVARSMLELDPSNVQDRLRLAEQFSRLSLIDEAADEYRRVLRLLEKKERKEEWGKVALRYLYHNPDDFSVRKNVVEWLLGQEDYHRALQHLHACFLKDPQDTELLDMASQSFEMLGQPAKAIVVLKTLSGNYRQKGLEKEEKDALNRILGLDPKDVMARKGLGMAEEEAQPEEEVELEWELPEGFHDAEEPAPLDMEDFDDEAPSFAEAYAEENTLVEPVSEDLFKELMSLEEGVELEDLRNRPQIDMETLSRAVSENRALTSQELEKCGVALTPGEGEELEFFLSAELEEEAVAILKEIYIRISGKS